MLNLKNDFSIDYTQRENVYKKLKEIQEERMKGKYDPRYHSQVLTYMLEQARDTRQKIEITLNLLNSLFETSKTSATGYLNREIWIRALNHLLNLAGLLENSSIKESLKNLSQKEKHAQNKDNEDEEEHQELGTHKDIEKSILPSLVNFVEKLDNELLKAYQSITHTKIEYLQRIRDENRLLFVCDKIISYLQDFNDFAKMARVSIIKLDHLHYKNDQLYTKMSQMTNGNADQTYIVKNS